jgi:3-hydroxyacyl-[acyl-carrier-protein] dehydratase
MPPPAILDPAKLDFSTLLADRAAIERVNPHRYEFALLDGVVYIDQAQGVYAGYHDVRADAFWVRGHVPGRPLLPGVLMIEAAAQLASFLYHQVFPEMGFLGFAGVDDVKFRGVVAPPCRLILVGRGLQIKPRRLICASQAFVGSTMVFEGTITGMPV